MLRNGDATIRGLCYGILAYAFVILIAGALASWQTVSGTVFYVLVLGGSLGMVLLLSEMAVRKRRQNIQREDA